MFRAYLVILGRAVLQVVSVAVLAELFPLRRHGGRSLYEVVFGVQIVGIVGVVDLLYIVQEAFERLFIAILIEHGRESLVELVERLDAREDVVGTGKPFAHLVAHLDLLKTIIKHRGVGADKLLYILIAKDVNGKGAAFLAKHRLECVLVLFCEVFVRQTNFLSRAVVK